MIQITTGAGNSEGEEPTEYGNQKQTGKGLYFFALARGYKYTKYLNALIYLLFLLPL